MAVTQHPALANRLRKLRTHGITRNAAEMHHTDVGPWYYEMHELGYNYRITDIQAVLGTVKWIGWVSLSRAGANWLTNMINCWPIYPCSCRHDRPSRTPPSRLGISM